MNGRQARALRRAVRQEAEKLMAPRALADVAIERKRQDDLWGQQDHLDGTGPEHVRPDQVEAVKAATESAFANDKGTWRHILAEEVMEAMAAEGPHLREELAQCAAVCVAWMEAIDRRARQAVIA